MKNNKKSIKCLIAMIVMVMAFTVTGVTAEAKTKTDKMTLLVGEKTGYTYIGMGKIKSVKSSKKSVVTAKKYRGGSLMTAKKAGKANVTVNGSRGKWIHKITVKKASFKVNYTRTADGDFIVSFKNNSSVYLDRCQVTLTFKDSKGNKVTTATAYMNVLGPKQTGYDTIMDPYYYDNIDYSKTTYTIDYNRSIDASYKNYSKKVKFTESKSGNYINIKAKTSYKGKGDIYIAYEVKYYDSKKQLIDVANYTTTLYKSRKNSTTQIYMPSSAASYKITKRVMLKTY